MNGKYDRVRADSGKHLGYRWFVRRRRSDGRFRRECSRVRVRVSALLKLTPGKNSDTELSAIVRIASAAVSALQLFAAVYTD
jgi:hypothetical protein